MLILYPTKLPTRDIAAVINNITKEFFLYSFIFPPLHQLFLVVLYI